MVSERHTPQNQIPAVSKTSAGLLLGANELTRILDGLLEVRQGDSPFLPPRRFFALGDFRGRSGGSCRKERFDAWIVRQHCKGFIGKPLIHRHGSGHIEISTEQIRVHELQVGLWRTLEC